jgi:glycosyltransferase involved in cell wall biosynthesis
MPQTELDVLLVGGRIEVRGSWVYTLGLARGLPGRGAACRVVARNQARVRQTAVRGIELLEHSEGDAAWLSLWARRRLLTALRRRPPTLIHGQSARMAPLVVWLADRLYCPCVLTVHEAEPEVTLLRFNWRAVRAVIATDDAAREALVSAARIPRPLLSVIKPGVSAGDSTALQILETGRTPVIGVVGPLDETMDHPLFLGAAKRVIETGREAQFLIAGAGPREAGLRRLVSELEIEAFVTFSDTLPETADALRALDLLCVPSRSREAALVALLAMALGRAVVVPAAEELNGPLAAVQACLSLCAPNCQGLANALLQLMENPVRARVQAAQARRLVAQEHALEPMLAQTLAVYRGALEEQSPGTIKLSEAAEVSRQL